MSENLTDEAAARRNILLSLGEGDPHFQDRILRDLEDREGLTLRQIGQLAPWDLSDLDDRYGWMSD